MGGAPPGLLPPPVVFCFLLFEEKRRERLCRAGEVRAWRERGEAWIPRRWGGRAKKERSRLPKEARKKKNVVVARATAPCRGALSLLFANMFPHESALFSQECCRRSPKGNCVPTKLDERANEKRKLAIEKPLSSSPPKFRLLPGPSAATRTAPPLLAALLGRAADDGFIVVADLREAKTGAGLAREAREETIFFYRFRRARKKEKCFFARSR